MNKLLNTYKPVGYTPLQIINKLKETYPEYQNEKIGYAGRLDPLAHGVLLLMVGEATKEKDKYLNLSKEYEFELLFGVETDTYDVLGLLNCHSREGGNPAPLLLDPRVKPEDDNIKNVNLIVSTFVKAKLGKHKQQYPPYSSKAVGGKPLFWWAKHDKLDEIDIPEHEIEIYFFELVSFGEITKKALEEKIQTETALVTGDFRQTEISKRWDSFFKKDKQNTFITASFKISCSSGTYIRGLVHELGKQIGCGAIALDILRTKVGEYSLSDSLKLSFD